MAIWEGLLWGLMKFIISIGVFIDGDAPKPSFRDVFGFRDPKSVVLMPN